jgi:hypothetical protein
MLLTSEKIKNKIIGGKHFNQLRMHCMEVTKHKYPVSESIKEGTRRIL